MASELVTPTTIKSILPPLLLLLGGILAIILFISAIVYFIVTQDCDVIFWVLLVLSILLGVLVSIGNTVNNFVVMNRFLTAIQDQCYISHLGDELLKEPLLSPWIGAIMSTISFLIFIAAIIYYLVTEQCDGWFWSLLIIAFVLDTIASFRDYVNTTFALRVAETELKTCKHKDKRKIRDIDEETQNNVVEEEQISQINIVQEPKPKPPDLSLSRKIMAIK